MICPKCHFEQPDDIFCAQCGVNVQKYSEKHKKVPSAETVSQIVTPITVQNRTRPKRRKIILPVILIILIIGGGLYFIFFSQEENKDTSQLSKVTAKNESPSITKPPISEKPLEKIIGNKSPSIENRKILKDDVSKIRVDKEKPNIHLKGHEFKEASKEIKRKPPFQKGKEIKRSAPSSRVQEENQPVKEQLEEDKGQTNPPVEGNQNYEEQPVEEVQEVEDVHQEELEQNHPNIEEQGEDKEAPDYRRREPQNQDEENYNE